MNVERCCINTVQSVLAQHDGVESAAGDVDKAFFAKHRHLLWPSDPVAHTWNAKLKGHMLHGKEQRSVSQRYHSDVKKTYPPPHPHCLLYYIANPNFSTHCTCDVCAKTDARRQADRPDLPKGVAAPRKVAAIHHQGSGVVAAHGEANHEQLAEVRVRGLVRKNIRLR